MDKGSLSIRGFPRTQAKNHLEHFIFKTVYVFINSLQCIKSGESGKECFEFVWIDNIDLVRLN